MIMIKSNLKQILDDRCINYSKFADKIGVTRQALDNWLQDKNYPTMDNMKRISKELGIDVLKIFFDEES